MNNKFFFIIFISFILLHIVLISTANLYPFIDLPNHLAEATIIKYYGHEGNEFSKYYSLSLFPKPNIFHPLFCSLPVFPSVETGNRVFYSLYIILLPLSVFMVIKKLKGNPWYSLMSFMLLYNYNVNCGFTGYTIAIPFIVLFFYFLIDMEERKNKIILIFLFILIFSMHAIGTLFIIFLFTVTVLIKKSKLIKKVKNFLILLPVTIIMFLWWSGSGKDSSLDFLLIYYKDRYFQTLYKRAGLFMFDNYFLYEGFYGILIALIFSLFIIIPSIIIIKEKKPLPVKIFIITALICFLCLPDRVPGNWCLYERFSVLFFIGIIFSNSIAFSKINKVYIILISSAVLLHFILWSNYFTAFQRENSSFNKDLFPHNVSGKNMGALIEDNKFRGKPVYLHFQNYYIIWKKAVASSMIIDYRFGCIRRKTDKEILPSYLDMVVNKNCKDLEKLDYILVRGNPKIPEHFKIIRNAGKWSVYQKFTANCP